MAQTRTLYEPSTEHDACGFGFVVRHRRAPLPRDRPGRPDGPRQPGAPRRHRVRGQHRRRRRDPRLHPPPLPGRGRGRGRASASRETGYGVAMVFLPRDEASRAGAVERFEHELRGEGLELLGWREVPTDPSGLGVQRARQPAGHRPGVHRPPGGPRPRPRRGPGLRAPPLRRPPPGREGRRPQRAARPRRRLHPVDVLPDHRLQGDAQRLPAADLLPGPARRALREPARPGPLPLLDQHLPVVVPGAPVPVHQPQRRDQHAARQRELDVRPPVHVPVDGVRRGPQQDPAGGGRGRLGHHDLRQRPGAAPPVGPEPRPHDDDDGPRAVEPGPVDVARSAARSTSTTRASWSRGTARRRWRSRTACASARRWTATASAPAATP